MIHFIYHFIIGPNLAARIPQAQKHFSSYLPKQKNAGSFVFKPVTPNEIESEILSTPLNKVYGMIIFLSYSHSEMRLQNYFKASVQS